MSEAQTAKDPEPAPSAAPAARAARAAPASWVVRFGAFVFRYRDALFPVVAIVAVAVSRPAPLAGAGATWLLGVGAVVAVSGQLLRLAVIGYAYIVRGGKGGEAYAEELVREGFFAHARHPLYTGNQMIVVGLCLMYGTAFTIFGVIPLFLFIYLAMALNEEAFLTRTFSAEYERYMEEVPRFIPDFRGLSASLEPYRYDWKRALRKDYGQIALTVGAAILIATLRGRTAWPWAVIAGQVAGAVTILAYLIVRTLKKKRLLES